MTTVTFFNAHPPDTIFDPKAFLNCVGQEVPITVNGQLVGHGLIKRVAVLTDGVEFTYETDADLGVEIDIPLSVASIEIEEEL